MESLSADWLEAKEAERQAQGRRLQIEKELVEMAEIGEQFEGSKTFKPQGFKVRISRSFRRKVDGEKLQAVAEQHGLFSYLQELFRWKPEIDKKAWDSAEEQVTRVLSAAITTAPGKPSVTIEQEA
jgi:hypothetical protein